MTLTALQPLPVSLTRLLLPFVPGTVQDAWPQATQARLTQCVLLALLLHIWLVLMLGSAPAGTALPGRGVWGDINITLRGPAQDGVPTIVAPPVPPPPTGPAGTAPNPRVGGAVRAPGPPPPAQPGAAQLGDWAARRTPDVGAAPAPLPAPTPALEAAPPPPLPTPVPAPVPVPVPVPVPERRLAASPGIGAPGPTRSAPLARTAAPTETPVRLAWPERLPEPTLLPPALAPVAAPSAPALAEAPAAAPVPPVRRIEPVAPAPPVALAPLPNTAGETPLRPPQATPLPGPPVAGPAPASPAAGTQLGYDMATPPSAPASAAPRLNLQLARPRAGELSRGSATGVLPLLARPPELPDKLARDIEKAGKGNCRSAYGGMGILAVVPLAMDAVSGSGKDGACKW